MNSNLRVLFCIVLGVALFCLVAPLLPFQDDWTYLTAPNPDFAWRDLLPRSAFWRPFDALWGGILGRIPWLFPWVNRVAIVLGHVLCVWLLIRMVDLLCEERRGRFAAIGFFAVSSGIAAVIVNTDSLNLVWSCVWGCVGTLALLKGRSLILVFGCYAVSVLCKESGLSWLAVGPLLAYAKDSNWRRLGKLASVGACLFVAYLCLRFSLQGKVMLGNEGDYALTLLPKIVGRNFAILVGMSLSSVDGLALGVKPVVFWTTVVLSGAAWLSFVWCVRVGRGGTVAKWLFVSAGVIAAFAAPHCFFKNHHPAEMHFYPVILGGVLALALAPLDKARRVPFCTSVVAMCIVFAMGLHDKMSTMYATSARAKGLLAEIRDKVLDFDTPMEYRVKAVPGLKPYSVYSQSPAWCLDHGRALRCLNEWRESKVVIVEE